LAASPSTGEVTRKRVLWILDSYGLAGVMDFGLSATLKIR